MSKRKLSVYLPPAMQNNDNGPITTLLTSPFAKMMQSGMFTFLVGPEEAEFNVHVQAFAKASTILEKIMIGDTEGSVSRVTKLPDIDPKVFIQFAQFCYVGNYTFDEDTNPNLAEFPSATIGLLSGRGAEHSSLFRKPGAKFEPNAIGHQIHRRAGSSRFHCTKCLRTNAEGMGLCYSKPAEYPFCGASDCTSISDDHLRVLETETLKCTKCCKIITAGIGSTCSECVIACLGRWPRDIRDCIELTHFADQSTTFLEILTPREQMYESFLSMMTRRSPVSDDLLAHLKLYVFAKTYNVDILPQIAVTKFCYDLSQLNLAINQGSMVTNLVKYVYQITSSSPGIYSVEDLLRKVVMKFVALNSKVLGMYSRGIHDLVRQGGEIAVDLFEAMAAI